MKHLAVPIASLLLLSIALLGLGACADQRVAPTATSTAHQAWTTAATRPTRPATPTEGSFAALDASGWEANCTLAYPADQVARAICVGNFLPVPPDLPQEVVALVRKQGAQWASHCAVAGHDPQSVAACMVSAARGSGSGEATSVPSQGSDAMSQIIDQDRQEQHDQDVRQRAIDETISNLGAAGMLDH